MEKTGLKVENAAAAAAGGGGGAGDRGGLAAEPREEMYQQQAEHLIKRGIHGQALEYLKQALEINPESKVSFSLRIQSAKLTCTEHTVHIVKRSAMQYLSNIRTYCTMGTMAACISWTI